MSGFINGVGSGLAAATATVGAVGRVASTVGNLAGALGALASGNPGGIGYGQTIGGLGVWSARLQPASWRGCGFAVRQSPIKRGRRFVVHEYPYRDDVWVEDLGRGVRATNIVGFICGDDVYDQRDAMVTAVETARSGTLVHPSLGSLTATLVDFTATERAELGRVVELEFSFIVSGQTQPQYPTTDESTQDQVDSDADDADSASAGDFGDDVLSALQTGANAVSAGVATANQWVGTATTLVGDAGRVVGAVRGLAGVVGGGAYFGRFNAGGLSVAPILATPLAAGLSTIARTTSAVNSLLSASITAGTAVKTAANSFTGLVGAL